MEFSLDNYKVTVSPEFGEFLTKINAFEEGVMTINQSKTGVLTLKINHPKFTYTINNKPKKLNIYKGDNNIMTTTTPTTPASTFTVKVATKPPKKNGTVNPFNKFVNVAIKPVIEGTKNEPKTYENLDELKVALESKITDLSSTNDGKTSEWILESNTKDPNYGFVLKNKFTRTNENGETITANNICYVNVVTAKAE